MNGQPKVVSQIYLGTAENIGKKFQEVAASQRPIKVKAEEFGSLFIGYEMEKQLDTIGIIDGIVKRQPREKGPTIGEYFFYGWLNRLIAPKRKRALGEWYTETAVQEIRPINLKVLDSMHYWEKWDRITEQDIEKIGKAFFSTVWKTQASPPECVLFDTTNYYTYRPATLILNYANAARTRQEKINYDKLDLGFLSIDKHNCLCITMFTKAIDMTQNIFTGSLTIYLV